MGEFEAIGDAVTGGIAARAVEPKAGEIAADGHTHEINCLNCGTKLEGEFCHACGQHAHVHKTLAAFFHDFLHGVLHFEGKIWRTLPMLVWRPGELTRRYIDGQRASFVSPIALFLFCVFLTFAVAGMTGALDSAASEAASSDLSTEVSKAKAKVDRIEDVRAEAISTGRPTAKIDEKLTDARQELAAVTAVATGKPDLKFVTNSDSPGWIKRAVTKAGKNPELLIYKLKTNAYKYSWALIPISVPFVWLLFPFSRRFGVYDHTIFVTYSLCFMMLLLVVGSVVGLVLPTIASIAWLVPPFHMYRQLKGTYAVGLWGGILRTLALMIFAFVAIGLFSAAIVGLGEV